MRNEPNDEMWRAFEELSAWSQEERDAVREALHPRHWTKEEIYQALEDRWRSMKGHLDYLTSWPPQFFQRGRRCLSTENLLAAMQIWFGYESIKDLTRELRRRKLRVPRHDDDRAAYFFSQWFLKHRDRLPEALDQDFMAACGIKGRLLEAHSV